MVAEMIVMKWYYIYVLSFLILIGCSKDSDTCVLDDTKYSPQFCVAIDSALTRIYVNDAFKVCWNEGDKLSVFTSTENQKYQFDGITGDLEGTFSVMEMSSSSTGSSLAVDANYALYPYDEDVIISNDGKLTLNLPQHQIYLRNSFGVGSNPMIAVTETCADTYLLFKNICGYLRLYLYGDNMVVKSISLEGNLNERISGQAVVSANYDEDPSINLTEAASKTILLQCQDGVQLGKSETEATEFWFVVPPVIFENGFTLIIEDINGNKYTKSTEKKIEIKRNVVSDMAASKIEHLWGYQLFEKGIDGIDAAVTNDGNYCALVDVNNESKQMMAILGNTRTDSRDYVLMDSLGIIHNFTLDSEVYSIIYGDDNISVFCNDNWECDLPYEKFHDSNENVETRASSLTRNPIYKLATKISIISDAIKSPKKAIILAVLQSQLGDNDDLLNFIVDAIDGIDILEAIKWIDRVMDINYFGNACISTLAPHEISICNYNLGCYTQIPTMDTPFYKENSHRGVSYTFRVTMNLIEDCIGGEEYSKELELLDEETWFNFQNLSLNSKYRYEPRLEVEYSISDEAYWLSIGEDPQKIGAQKVRRSLYGEELSFTTGSVSSSVEKVENEKPTSADVICSFSDAPPGAVCEILITKEGTDMFRIFSGKPDCKNQKVSISGLMPSTTYTASSRIIYEGIPYNGSKSVSFSTPGPSGFLIAIPEEHITTTSAVVKCQFSNIGSDTECGIIVKSKDGSSKQISVHRIEGEQDVTISGLTSGYRYTCIPYVRFTHSHGEYYKEGDPLSFVTRVPKVVIESVTNITTTSATINIKYENMSSEIDCNLRYDTNGYFYWVTTPSEKINLNGEGTASVTLTNLYPGVSYEVWPEIDGVSDKDQSIGFTTDFDDTFIKNFSEIVKSDPHDSARIRGVHSVLGWQTLMVAPTGLVSYDVAYAVEYDLTCGDVEIVYFYVELMGFTGFVANSIAEPFWHSKLYYQLNSL